MEYEHTESFTYSETDDPFSECSTTFGFFLPLGSDPYSTVPQLYQGYIFLTEDYPEYIFSCMSRWFNWIKCF